MTGEEKLEKLKKNYQGLLVGGSFIILFTLFIFAVNSKKDTI
jgi:hypothetical protein